MEDMYKLELSSIKSQYEEKLPEEFGKSLYNKVFSGILGEYINERLADAEKIDNGLRISLQFDDSVPELFNLPWEFLYNGKNFLVTDRTILISRGIKGRDRRKLDPLNSILRMLVVISNPIGQDMMPLNTEHEQEVILEAIDKPLKERKISVDFTNDATFENIQNYLLEDSYHIFHFIGHGSYHNDRGYLVLESESGDAREVDNRAITDLLVGRNIRLVVLNSCQSGKASSKEAYADLASLLAKENIPAVVAMQYPIIDTSATRFAATFYHALASKSSIDLALTEARISIKNAENSNGIDFATPILYLSDPNCLTQGKIDSEAQEVYDTPKMFINMPIMEKSFVGRQEELRLLQKLFQTDQRRAAIIYGLGGIGKTALASRLAVRMNKQFEGIFGMRFNAATRSEDVLEEINNFLLLAGINNLNQIIHEQIHIKVKAQILINILIQHRYLLIFDNLEDCLDEERRQIANPGLKEFVQHLLENIFKNTKIILTTRYNFDPLDGKLVGAIEPMPLPSLSFPQAVWLMNRYRQLEDLSTNRKLQIYRAIGGHPWIIDQFASHAAAETVDSLMLDMAFLRDEAKAFTLLEKTYSKLDQDAKRLLLWSSIYDEAVPVEALSWIVGNEKMPRRQIGEPLKKLIDWGLVAEQQTHGKTLYLMHTLAKDLSKHECQMERLDRKTVLLRAAQYYENQVAITGNLWDLLYARRYYFQAEQWEIASDMAENSVEHLVGLGYIEKAIDLLNQSIKTTSGTRKAAAKGNLAIIYYHLRELKTALRLYEEVKDISEKEGQKENVAIVLHMMGLIKQDQGDYDEAIRLYQQSMKIDEHMKMFALYQIGVIYQIKGNYNEAIKFNQQSLKISNERGNEEGIAKALAQMANINLEKGNNKEAFEFYKQGLNIFKKLGNREGIAQSLHQFGVIYRREGNYEKAFDLCYQSLKMFEELGHKDGIANSHNLMGLLHEAENDYNHAVEDFLIALKLYEGFNSPYSKMVKANINRIKDKIGDKEFLKALEKYQDA